MKPRHLLLAPLLLPAMRPAEAIAEEVAQRYDSSYQIYQEDNDRIRVESFYMRGKVDVNADTSFRFQYLHDSISGSTPTGQLPSGNFLSPTEDIREGILAALSRQFGDHRVDFEASYNKENDYKSTGLSLSDAWEINRKNTTLAFGLNYNGDQVRDPFFNYQDKTSLDFFTGITQIIDKNTVVTVNLTLGSNNGYLNDPYKDVTLTDAATGVGDTYWKESRPDSRFREVLQMQGTHYFEKANGALDAILRLSNDDYGVFSQSFQIEWRQALGDKFEVTPFFRYYRQSAADFFMNIIDGVFPIGIDPPDRPDGSGPHYSADYRLSELDAVSIGLRMRYQFDEFFSASASYERYEMSGQGSDTAPSAAYPSADIWTFCLAVKF
jgi:hypothetical protein